MTIPCLQVLQVPEVEIFSSIVFIFAEMTTLPPMAEVNLVRNLVAIEKNQMMNSPPAFFSVFQANRIKSLFRDIIRSEKARRRKEERRKTTTKKKSQ